MIARILTFAFFTTTMNVAVAQDSLRVQLHGAVIDHASGLPIYEALVEWYDAHGKRQAITQTNSEGSYALFVPAGQPIELRVTENGYQPFVEQVPPFEAGESARQVDLHLVPK